LIVSRNNRQPRRERRRTSPTVVRTHVAVITAPGGNDGTLSFQHEVELVKAALLYADTVEVLSPGNQMIREVNKFSAGDGTNMYSLLGSLDDDTLRYMQPDMDVSQFREFLPYLMLDVDELRRLGTTNPEVVALADILDQSNDMANSAMAEMREIAETMRNESGVAEIETAMATGLLRFNDRVPLDGDSDAVVRAFINQLKRYLHDPTKFVLLDSSTASLARAMINEGMVQPPERAVSNASEALLGTGFVARLPAFTEPPMDELLDARRDLNEPLGRYRRNMSHLRTELRGNPFDEHVGAEIDAIWRTEVSPAILEIRQAMADHGLIRELLRSAGQDISNFVSGGWLRAGVAIFSGDVLDLGTAVTAGITALSTAAPTAASGVLARQRGRAEARTHDLYYLYEVDRRLT